MPLSHEAENVPYPRPSRDLQAARSQAPRVLHKRRQQYIAPPAQATMPPDDSPYTPNFTNRAFRPVSLRRGQRFRP